MSGYKRSSKGILQNLALISQVGIMMLVPIIGGVLLGAYLDRLAKTNGIFLIIFVLLGVGTSFRNLYVLSVQKGREYADRESAATYVSKFEKEVEKERQNKSDKTR